MSIIKFQKSHNDFVALDLTIYHYYIIGRRECQYRATFIILLPAEMLSPQYLC